MQHPSAWYGEDLANDPSWLVHLTPNDLAEIEAQCGVSAHSLELDRLGAAISHCPHCQRNWRAWLEEIRTGRGFVGLRGLNVTDYTDDEVGLIFWALGAYLGIPVTQNPRGDLLGHVYDHGRRYGDIDVRGYETNAHLPFHSDGCDLVGLLCLRRCEKRRAEQHRQLGHTTQRDPAAASGVLAAAV